MRHTIWQVPRVSTSKTALVPVLLPPDRALKTLRALPTHGDSGGPAIEAEGIQITALLPDARMLVMAERRARSSLLTGTEAPTALPHSRIHLSPAPLTTARERDWEVPTIVIGVQDVVAEIDYLVPFRCQLLGKLLFHLETAVIGGDPYSHTLLLSP
jgi:hypothetical protein